MATLEEKVRGSVFGAVIGDALGTLTEDMDRETIEKAYGGAIFGLVKPSPLAVCPHLKKGQFSHESQIFLITLKIFAEKGRFDEEAYIEELLSWLERREEHRYPSGAHLNAALSYKAGLPQELSAVKASDIDGAIPAVACGIFYYDDTERAYEESARVSSLTHQDEILLDVAGTLGAATSLIIGGRAILEVADGSQEFLENLISISRTPLLKEQLIRVRELLKEELPLNRAALLIGNGTFAPEAFSLALYLFLKYHSSYQRAVLAAANAHGEVGGDTDAIAFITGAFCGGYLGISSIPKEWLSCLEKREEIELLLSKLLEKLV